MVLLSKHHKCEAYADDVTEIFAAVEQSMAEAKKQMEAVNETN